ncbi:rhomboid protein, putative [Entamoeba invadens IP1]|uniref:Rhomboid protein, putative n=1 Tax=Entamoeba invadens IP1 TaxID=370355 RepID=A0A0A1UFI7_ENTIV|nr:rhomboid protein, putative [Entamoeba invadens IP1]ELP92694.1 rhomboid protein, putative [Entamoeba invadens IP1]|eukprot:XP_004259465.1 rhomboid protein, putative [Entamoeba invadens IP1]
MSFISYESVSAFCKDFFSKISMFTTVLLSIIVCVFLSGGSQFLRSFSTIVTLKDFSSGVVGMFTHSFVHANILHIVMNSMALFGFGCTVEYRIGTVKFIVLFIVSLVFNPVFILSAASIGLIYNTDVVGMSGFLFTLMVVEYYKEDGYIDIIYSITINIVIYIIGILFQMPVSLAGHFSGILVGFLYTRGFLDFLFDNRVIDFIEKKMELALGCLVLFKPAQHIEKKSHVEILHTIKSDIKNMFVCLF